MKHVYVVAVESDAFKTLTVSSEAYSTLKKAQMFIQSRSDCPERITDFKYKGKNYNYSIYELIVK